LEQLEKRFEEIKNLCQLFNARAYIRLSRRDARTIAKDMIVELGEAFRNDSFKHLRKIYSTVVGRSVGLDKIRILDLDDDKLDGITFGGLQRFLMHLKPEGEKVIEILRTKN
jgi:hypothetical protein